MINKIFSSLLHPYLYDTKIKEIKLSLCQRGGYKNHMYVLQNQTVLISEVILNYDES